MNKRQSNKLNMYNAVITFLQNNQQAYSAMPAMQAQVTELENKTQNIIDSDAEREGVRAGKIANKLKEEKELHEVLNKVISALFVYAQIIENNEIKDEADYSSYELIKMRDNDFLEKGYAIYNLAAGLKTELADYGISEDDIESIKTNADEFAEALGIAGAAGAESKEKTAGLQAIFDDVDDLLYDRIDKLVEIFKTSDEAFYEGYTNARQIIDR
ncbi:MAG: hypothetical protein PVH88_02830 [Ignavibacteria bacterium]